MVRPIKRRPAGIAVLSMILVALLSSWIAIPPLFGAKYGYTYRVMERRQKARIKKWQRDTVGSQTYRRWVEGFSTRIKCLSSPEAKDPQFQLRCLRKLPTTKTADTSQQQTGSTSPAP